ncbi:MULTISPECIES: hypothetical protein [unclassified Acinetobacter]|uniref:hypothetical protein n=1 Tax=unclassified Acinetobacter TaxID=196816 RepID=UPI0024469B59|nr:MULTISPECIES: hypothetical protein [unclassified Acinetobacter]MDH0032032.1 hypothetical protein [Acinetobacter sp. GD04021]MDH0887688.1 hypothetical protein [Acinetobacter sp. GD03873]MDH1084036.1 hypothetical protein [Acinetobacter sp. GD03983]MDH2191037.1 hypothetical protein [Acinetobacter sp. GD03645]MDH2204548.1 hypothetical protein [Acinetobacter sp. GD03647]
MNAIQFIQKNGIEKAREVVEGAPEHSLCYDLEQQKHVAYEDTSIAMCFLKNRFIDLSELKRLVESVDLIKGVQGIEEARSILQNIVDNHASNKYAMNFEKPALEQAIADWECIYEAN